MKHIVKVPFRDKLDRNAKKESFPYAVGDKYPRGKRKVSDERLEELTTKGFIAEKED